MLLYAVINVTAFLLPCLILDQVFGKARKSSRPPLSLAGISCGSFLLAGLGKFFGIPIVIFRPPIEADQAGTIGLQAGILFGVLSFGYFLVILTFMKR
jgi:hypothetical protein